MTLNLVEQLWFTRREFMRCIDGMLQSDAEQRILPMNSISWIVGHLADQENNYWVSWGLGLEIFPNLHDLVGFGKPPSTPPLIDMRITWQDITNQADKFLEKLTPSMLQKYMEKQGKSRKETIGTMLYRNIYHYWFHLGEAYSVRQLLGHTNLPVFVGNMDSCHYKPENPIIS